MSHRLIVSSYILGLCLLSGCSTPDRHSVRIDSALAELKPQIQFAEEWQRTLGKGPGETFPRLTPALSGNSMVVTDRKNKLLTTNVADGKKLWSKQADEAVGSPGVGAGRVIIGTGDASITAYSLDTGDKLWRTDVSGESPSAPTVHPHVTVVKTVDGTISGLSTQTGEMLWSVKREVPLISVRGTGGSLIVGETVITGEANGKLMAIDLRSGEVLWEAVIAAPRGRSELERLVDIDVTPLFNDDVVFVSSYLGRVAAVSPESGEIYWARELPTALGMAVDNSRVYIVDADGSVWCLDQNNGSTYWRQDLFKHKLNSAPVVFDDWIAIGDMDGHVALLDKRDGGLVTHYSISSDPIVLAPLVYQNLLIVVDEDGDATALRLAH